MRVMFSSNTPSVLGLVIISAATSSFTALASSSTSTIPRSLDLMFSTA